MPGQTPQEFIKVLLGRPVVVYAGMGSTYKGILASIDENMNIALEQTEEWKNDERVASYGDAFIRSNSIIYIGLNYTE